MKGLEQRRFGNDSLARSGGGRDHQPLVAGKPGEEGFLLHGVGNVRKLIEIFGGKVVAGRLTVAMCGRILRRPNGRVEE